MSERHDVSHSTIKNMPIEGRVWLHGVLIESAVLPSCANCIMSAITTSSTRKDDLRCDKFNAFPPIAVLIQGCKDWEQDIPF